MILKVGLTGGIASGKSTIARMFADLGCRSVDADAIVAQLYEPGAAGHTALVQRYGSDVLRADGSIDRQRVSQIAFATPEAARELNSLIHPIVLAEESRMTGVEEERLRGEDAIFVVEATLLIEAGGRSRYDRIIVVDVTVQTQLARGTARGMARDEVLRRLNNQLGRDERLRVADYVIDNSGDLDEARRAVAFVYASLRDDLEEKKKAPGSQTRSLTT